MTRLKKKKNLAGAIKHKPAMFLSVGKNQKATTLLDCRNIVVASPPGATSILTLAADSHLHSSRAEDTPGKSQSVSSSKSEVKRLRESPAGHRGSGRASRASHCPAFHGLVSTCESSTFGRWQGRTCFAVPAEDGVALRPQRARQLQEKGLSSRHGTEGVWIVAFYTRLPESEERNTENSRSWMI